MQLRFVAHADAEQISDLYAPYVRETPVSFETTPPDADEIERRIEKTTARYPWLVCERDDAILGYAYASDFSPREAYQWSAESSVYVRRDAHRNGIGRVLYATLFRLLREQGFYNAYAGLTLPNPGSVGLHESVGFEPVGVYEDVGHKHGEWYDVQWWHKVLAPHPAEPTPPVAVDELDEQIRRDALDAGTGLLGG
ncbi:arsinothricin resistance N-acetyltransferase ArsN1 family B [Haloferacaceae archaeon DSL9]